MRAPIRMVALAARHEAVQAQVEASVLQVLRSGSYLGGPLVAEAEQRAAQWLGRAGAVGVASGTDALILGLMTLGVQPGQVVAVPALTFFATAGAVCAIGAVPLVVDVSEDGTLNPSDLAARAPDNLAAIVPVHLWGQRAAHPGLDLPILEDAAQAIGCEPPARLGTLSALSCYPTKTWGAAGDAGFVAADDPELLARARALGHHGATGPHEHHEIGGQIGRNSRLGAIQAAVLLAHAEVLPARLAARRAHAAHYDAALPPSLRPMPRAPGHAVHQYVIRAPRRDALRDALRDAGIETAVYYPRPLHHQPALSARLHPNSGAPYAEALCAELLALPVHANLTEAERDYVVAALWEHAE